MKPGTLLTIGAAGLAAWALWTLYQRLQAAAPAPSVGVGIPALSVPPAGLSGALVGDTWAAIGADQSKGFTLPDPWGSP